MSKAKTLIVFDIDDTLTKTAKMHQQFFVEALEEIGVQEMDTNFGDYLHHTDSYIAACIYEKDKRSPFTAEVQQHFEALLYEKIRQQPIPEIRGARALLQNLQETAGSPAYCFATGSLYRPALYKLKALGISTEEGQLVASDQLRERENIVRKAIDLACKRQQLTAFDRVIALGDGLWDLRAAQNLGIDFIGVGTKHRKLLLEEGAATVYEDLSKLCF